MDEIEPGAVRKHSRSSWAGDSLAAVVLVVVFWVPQLLSASGAWQIAAGTALALLAAVSVIVRWRLPTIAPVAALVATGGAWFLQVSSDPMLAVAWCLYPLALRRGRRSQIIGGAAVAVMIPVSLTYGAPPSAAGVDQRIIFAAVAIGAAWLLGQAEAKRLKAVRESADQQAAYERAVHQASMAREVHDVVGHALSVISAEAEVSRSLPDIGQVPCCGVNRLLRDGLGLGGEEQLGAGGFGGLVKDVDEFAHGDF